MTRRAWIAAGVVTFVVAASVGASALVWRSWERSKNTRTERIAHVADAQPQTAPSGAPNVVVVIGCTLRRDQLSVYRPELDSTPYLRGLADRGVVFEDLVTAAPWTRPASVALVTGTHAVNLGMIEPGAGLNRRQLHEDVVTLAEHFRDHGWHTVGGTANPNLSSTWNMHQGFEAYIQPQGTWADGQQGKMRSGHLLPDLLDEVESRPAGKPVFLQAMFIEAHAPWRKLEEGVAAADKSVPERVHRYRNELGAFDRAVERLHDELRDRGLSDDNTLWVVLNDHGEGLSWPDHHGAAHGRYLAPSTVGGVWVMAGHGVESPRRVWGLASQVDVYPTLAELAGIPVKPQTQDGRSQATALVTGKTNRTVAYADTWFSKVSRAALYTRTRACQGEFSTRAATDGDGRFRSGCFDRVKDADHARPIQDLELMADLEQWRDERMLQMQQFTGASDADPSAATLDQLEALGYVDEE